MDFRKAQWIFPLLVALHNAEESIWFREWPREAIRDRFPADAAAFRSAACLLVFLAVGVTYASFRAGRQSVWTYLNTGYMAAILLNVFVPHVPLSLELHRYTPGLVTAVLLNLPILPLLLRAALRQGYVSGTRAAVYWSAVPLVLALSIPVLFRLGEALHL